MKYIDADKLISEIDRRMENYNATIEKYYGKQKSIKAERDSWKWAECKWFLTLITSLQQEQPEVDLEEKIDVFFDKWDKNSNGSIFDENGAPVTIKTIKGVVKHFLNARR